MQGTKKGGLTESVMTWRAVARSRRASRSIETMRDDEGGKRRWRVGRRLEELTMTDNTTGVKTEYWYHFRYYRGARLGCYETAHLSNDFEAHWRDSNVLPTFPVL